jgi:hypothetical protein
MSSMACNLTCYQPAANLTVSDSVRPHRLQSGFLNVDLTAIKKFGKWQLGPVAFGPTDLTRPVASYQKQSQFAAGGLVGYDFSQLTMQAYATTDVVGKITTVGIRASGSAL